MHHEKFLCFNPHCLISVDGNAECTTDYERAASLVRHTQLALEDDMLHFMSQQSNTWIAYLKGLENDKERFCRNSHISLEMLTWITLMDGGRLELLEKLLGLLQVKDLSRFVYPSDMKPSNSFPTKSSTSMEGGDAASNFEWRRHLLYKRTG